MQENIARLSSSEPRFLLVRDYEADRLTCQVSPSIADVLVERHESPRGEGDPPAARARGVVGKEPTTVVRSATRLRGPAAAGALLYRCWGSQPSGAGATKETGAQGSSAALRVGGRGQAN